MNLARHIADLRELVELAPGESPEQHRKRTGRCPPGLHWTGQKCGKPETPAKTPQEPKPKAAPEKPEPKKPQEPKGILGKGKAALNKLKDAALAILGQAKTDAEAVAAAAKDWGPKAKAKLERMPDEAKAFFTDKAFRNAALETTAEMARQAGKKIAKRVVATAKEEAHEFKEAGKALRSFAKTRSLKKIPPEEKKALGTVMKHMALTAAASAAVATGVKIPIVMAKGLAKHFAAKTVSKTAENLHIGGELTHLTHLFHDAAGDAEDEAALTRLAELITKSVAEVMDQGISPEELEQLALAVEEEAPKESLAQLVTQARLTMQQ